MSKFWSKKSILVIACVLLTIGLVWWWMYARKKGQKEKWNYIPGFNDAAFVEFNQLLQKQITSLMSSYSFIDLTPTSYYLSNGGFPNNVSCARKCPIVGSCCWYSYGAAGVRAISGFDKTKTTIKNIVINQDKKLNINLFSFDVDMDIPISFTWDLFQNEGVEGAYVGWKNHDASFDLKVQLRQCSVQANITNNSLSFASNSVFITDVYVDSPDWKSLGLFPDLGASVFTALSAAGLFALFVPFVGPIAGAALGIAGLFGGLFTGLFTQMFSLQNLADKFNITSVLMSALRSALPNITVPFTFVNPPPGPQIIIPYGGLAFGHYTIASWSQLSPNLMFLYSEDDNTSLNGSSVSSISSQTSLVSTNVYPADLKGSNLLTFLPPVWNCGDWYIASSFYASELKFCYKPNPGSQCLALQPETNTFVNTSLPSTRDLTVYLNGNTNYSCIAIGDWRLVSFGPAVYFGNVQNPNNSFVIRYLTTDTFKASPEPTSIAEILKQVSCLRQFTLQYKPFGVYLSFENLLGSVPSLTTNKTSFTYFTQNTTPYGMGLTTYQTADMSMLGYMGYFYLPQDFSAYINGQQTLIITDESRDWTAVIQKWNQIGDFIPFVSTQPIQPAYNVTNLYIPSSATPAKPIPVNVFLLVNDVWEITGDSIFVQNSDGNRVSLEMQTNQPARRFFKTRVNPMDGSMSCDGIPVEQGMSCADCANLSASGAPDVCDTIPPFVPKFVIANTSSKSWNNQVL
jgi:hypothetical protein